MLVTDAIRWAVAAYPAGGSESSMYDIMASIPNRTWSDPPGIIEKMLWSAPGWMEVICLGETWAAFSNIFILSTGT